MPGAALAAAGYLIGRALRLPATLSPDGPDPRSHLQDIVPGAGEGLRVLGPMAPRGAPDLRPRHAHEPLLPLLNAHSAPSAARAVGRARTAAARGSPSSSADLTPRAAPAGFCTSSPGRPGASREEPFPPRSRRAHRPTICRAETAAPLSQKSQGEFPRGKKSRRRAVSRRPSDYGRRANWRDPATGR